MNKMQSLYPLRFKPIVKEKIWGGNKLKNLLNKPVGDAKFGESWEISGVPGNVSVVENGFLAENSLEELIEIYMGDLVGEQVYEKFGVEFPLLIKFIDANDVLSIQVHPDDKMSKKRHNAYGKTEMWYVVQAEEGAELISGFNQKTDKETYLNHLNGKTLKKILNSEQVKEGDVFFIPAGRVHAIGSGILLAEIQQTSDITYRIYDWDRLDDEGNPRELHTDLALDAIDYEYHSDIKTDYEKKTNDFVELASCKYFTTNVLEFDEEQVKDYYGIDSFIIYMCLSGKFELCYGEDQKMMVERGNSLLLPASLNEIRLKPDGKAELLEVYIKKS